MKMIQTSLNEAISLLYEPVHAKAFLERKDVKPKQVELDIARTFFVSSTTERPVIESAWREIDLKSYSQGLLDASFFTAPLKLKLTNDESVNTQELPSSMSFGYLNEEGRAFGFSVFAYTSDLWMMCSYDIKQQTVNLLFSDAAFAYMEIDAPATHVATFEPEAFELQSHKPITENILYPTGSINVSMVKTISKALDVRDTNDDVISALTAQAPLRLTAANVIDTELKFLASKGFQITMKALKTDFIQIEAQESDEEDLVNKTERVVGSSNVTPFFLCEHTRGLKLALFYPSTDIMPDNADDAKVQSKAHNYLLHTQAIAQRYIDQGFTCILPVVEYGNFSILKSFHISRTHHVMLIWSKDELGFFDPKSGKPVSFIPKELAGYSNEVFKEFAANAGYQVENKVGKVAAKSWGLFGFTPNEKTYESTKEPKLQDTFDFNNCGYFCVRRFESFIHAALDKRRTPIRSSRLDAATVNYSRLPEELCKPISMTLEKPNQSIANYLKYLYSPIFPKFCTPLGTTIYMTQSGKTNNNHYDSIGIGEHHFDFVSQAEEEALLDLEQEEDTASNLTF